MEKAIVLLSGGLDSTTVLAIAQQKYECSTLSFAYGQRHSSELQAAQRIVAHHNINNHRIVQLDVAQFGGSALTDDKIAIADYQDSDDIPATYVPARNTIFLATALAWAEVLPAQHIFIGVSHVDYSGYPDCRPEFIAAFQQLANVATKTTTQGGGITIHAPLLHCSKAETIAWGLRLGIDYAQTISCYQADEQGRACGRCDSCVLRQQGFAQAKVSDPTRYRE